MNCIIPESTDYDETMQTGPGDRYATLFYFTLILVLSVFDSYNSAHALHNGAFDLDAPPKPIYS